MKEKDIDKTADQCRTKMTKLKLDYRKIKDKHNKTGKGRKNWNNWMHWILYQATDQQQNLLWYLIPPLTSCFFDEQESGHNSSDLEDRLTISDEVESSSSKSSSEYTNGSTYEDQHESPNGSPSTLLSQSVRRKRKRTKDAIIEDVLTNVVKEVIESQSASDLKAEEK